MTKPPTIVFARSPRHKRPKAQAAAIEPQPVRIVVARKPKPRILGERIRFLQDGTRRPANDH